ncbi:substrate-binding domain-containing protein [Tropicimonas sp. TH_r6]|uniref:sugar ABC transporter substrate-binding protein n=1 Tax=Tropicimonas sp. TH_r6 TaxID=3082085 RepID=UPI002954C8E5|nr:substrate-binding domain-containing protein [Tropicimonas sp. TH_r6]MDV7141824.1 substrate-binding domain-containing protein [Tropicimonas sp. TH_r6]
MLSKLTKTVSLMAVAATFGIAAPVAAGEDRMALYERFGEIPVPSKEYRIGVILKTFNNDYFIDLKNGFQDAADKYGVKVEFFAAPGETDLLIQKQLMEDMLVRQFDLIAVNPSSTSNLLEPAARATKMGIPLINVNDAYISKEDQEKHNIDIISFISTDWAEQMRHHVRYCAEKLGDEGGQIAHIMGFPGSTAATQRLEGYETELAKFPQLESVAVLPADWDRKKAMDVAADMIQANPDIKCLSASNDNMALGAIQALKNAGKLGDMIVMGCDGIPDAVTAIQNDELTASVAFMQYENGYNTIEAAILHLEGMGDKIPETLFANQEIWDKSNIDDKIANYGRYYSGMAKLTN